MYFPTTKWSWSFIAVALIQAAIILAFESYAFAIFQIDLQGNARQQPVSKAIPTFLALYIFGFIYQLILVYDALRLKNTIQVIGLVMLNVGLLVYGGVQLDTIQDGVKELGNNTSLNWGMVQPYLIAIPCIIAFGSVCLGFIAWKLYDEFSWTIYKHISADLKMKRRYLNYQIFIALLKFDFFFFLGFTIQFVVIVRGKNPTEFGLTIAAIPVTILILIAAAFFTRREKMWGMMGVLVLFIGGLAYFVFKLTRMYTDRYEQPYIPARKELTTFAAITIVLILLTILNAIVCIMNFNKGLRPYISRRKLESDEEKLSHGPVRPQYFGPSGGHSQSHDGNVPGYGYGQTVEMVDGPYGKPGPRMEID